MYSIDIQGLTKKFEDKTAVDDLTLRSGRVNSSASSAPMARGRPSP